jgi:hypothetical protein
MGLTDWGGVIFQVQKRRARDDGLHRNILSSALSISLGAKLGIVVDEDIDIYNMEDVMWALATRVNPRDDIMTVCEGGFGQTWSGRLAWERDPRAWEAVAAARDGEAAARLVRSSGVDLACLPTPGALDALEARVAGLGVGGLLRWIHAFLTWRWVVSPPARAFPDARLAIWTPPELDVPAYALAAERIAR